MEISVSSVEKSNRSYMAIFLGITFGLSWGLSLVYILFYDYLYKYVGELTLSNPFVIISLNSPSIAGLIIFFLYGRRKAIGQFLKSLVPNKKECIWFPIILAISVIFYICMHYLSVLFGFALPEVTLSVKDRIILLLKNIYEETGLLGGAVGWYGFLLPYLQKKNKSAIKSALLTGLIFGLFVLPGYAFSSFETTTAYPFYVGQLMAFSVFIAFVMNKTRGNVLFFVFSFWLVASGSKLQFYNFIVSVQILEFVFFIILAAAIYYYFKRVKNEDLDKAPLAFFPDYLEDRK